MDWSKASELIKHSNIINIFTHCSMDGDAMGSSIALCRAMRALGKEAWIIIEDAIPTYLSFLPTEYFITPEEIEHDADLAVAVDISSENRLENRAGLYHGIRASICIDHHEKPDNIADLMFVDNTAAASAVLVLDFILYLETQLKVSLLDKTTAEMLYTGIVTDTGEFKYSNADAKALLSCARLYEAGIDHAGICVKLYDNDPLPKLRLESLAIDHAQVFSNGRAVISWCTREDIISAGADYSMADACIDRIRKISGVEIAAFVKEKEDGCCKVNLRAKTTGNVRDIAAVFGGGGHIKAAGCTMYCQVSEAVELLKNEIGKRF